MMTISDQPAQTSREIERYVEQPLAMPQPAIDPLVTVRRSLRGRMGWVSVIGLIAAAVGAAAGWRFDKPLFRSEGLVRIAYQLPIVANPTDQNAPIVMFDAFMRSQELKMASRSMIEVAMKDPAWKDAGRGSTPGEIADFADHLTVEHPAGTEELRVLFDDPDPMVAAIGVNVLVKAFEQAYDDSDKQSQDQRLNALRDSCQKLRSELNGLEDKADRIAVADTLIHQKIAQEAAVEEELRRLRTSGYLDRYPRVQELGKELEQLHGEIDRYMQDLRPRTTDNSDPTAAAPASDTVALPELGSGSMPDSNRETILLSQKEVELERLKADAANKHHTLDEQTQRMVNLQLETTDGSRLEVISQGDIPTAPARDRRRLYAAAGAFSGVCLPIALAVLIGLVSPTLRFSDETDSGTKRPLLGILPILGDGVVSPERAAGAAHSIHHMRVTLQVGARGKRPVFLVTSACAGEGKTSLTTALALSYAASGSRTLVIDADMIGARLTHCFNAENREGLHEALAMGDAAPFVREVLPRLWLLPVGRASALHAGTMSGAAMAALLAAARRDYDIVLIDSGPILGSVEASVLAPEVDGVIAVVSRGQNSAMVERMFRQLEVIGAPVAGMVFNRARVRDFYRSSYGSNSRSASSPRSDRAPDGAPSMGSQQHAVNRFGPLVNSVTAFLPASRMKREMSEAAATAGTPWDGGLDR